jgi:hypothetical protein
VEKSSTPFSPPPLHSRPLALCSASAPSLVLLYPTHTVTIPRCHSCRLRHPPRPHLVLNWVPVVPASVHEESHLHRPEPWGPRHLPLLPRAPLRCQTCSCNTTLAINRALASLPNCEPSSPSTRRPPHRCPPPPKPRHRRPLYISEPSSPRCLKRVPQLIGFP